MIKSMNMETGIEKSDRKMNLSWESTALTIEPQRRRNIYKNNEKHFICLNYTSMFFVNIL